MKVVAEKMKGNALSRMLSLLNLTTRGVTQYAVHGFAGRVGPSVFKNEALSKLKRMREKVEPPEELQHPRRLLKLDEGEFQLHDSVGFSWTGQQRLRAVGSVLHGRVWGRPYPHPYLIP